jgi:hypothetical protein
MTTSTSHRLIAVHTSSLNDFLEGAGLVFKAGTASGDYHGQMNADNFEKRLNEMVITKLPPASVLVMVMCHIIGHKWINCCLHQPCTKIINSMKLKEKTFRVDKLLESHGHSVVRLPPYMCELSPIELAWAKMKRHVRYGNTTRDISMKLIEELVMEGLNEITAADWLGFFQHVVKLEQEFWANDGIMEDVLESFIITLTRGPGRLLPSDSAVVLQYGSGPSSDFLAKTLGVDTPKHSFIFNFLHCYFIFL